jgi:hypothetical protein
MGIVQIPAAVAGATRNVVAFTSTQTWTVPSSAKYVDVLVIGGGGGGRGGYRTTYASDGGSMWAGGGGGVTMLRDIFLNGTGTVSVVVGAGASGTAGTATTTISTNTSTAGFSAFGTFCYSAGAGGSNTSGAPGYKGTASITAPGDYRLWKDTTQSNWAPIFESGGTNATAVQFFGTSTDSTKVMNSVNATGLFGGGTGAITSTLDAMRAGGNPGFSTPSTVSPASAIYTNTLPQIFPSSYTAFAGNATAGSSGGGSGAVGAAGQKGFAGGGGTTGPAINLPGGQGGPGAGGGPSAQASTGTNGGNGGNAGTNTGAGGGGGGNTGSTSAGTGGNGGNGGSGIVIVSWLS